VIVPAARRGSPARRGSSVQAVVLGAVLVISASHANAQAGAAVSIFSDDRFRGYSLSDGRPVGTVDLSYDASNGFYGALSGSVVAARHEGLQPLGFQLNAGYAKRLSPTLTLDLGITHAHYSTYASRGPGKDYTEAYVGLAGKLLSGRISISPDYLKRDLWTAYGEVNGNVPAGRNLRITGHVGMLIPFESRVDYQRYRPELDWRLGLARDFGPLTASIAWSGLQRGRDLYQERSRSRRAFVFGVTYVL
jgi:uncharacterized protein (TIGR02001 family)